ncbi:helix-turn-helix domain-containing protein [Pedobacter sp. SAFR-022]|uniref:helix-turn-helix domain-containing protein n=1 Tax=Pedobacter sp. SAFR-022 TaxID=3436861 RepID=UPI003F7E22A6
MTKLHAKLRLLRVKHNMTQQQVAVKLNCSVPAYSKLETGATDVTGSRLIQLAAIYNCGIDKIFTFGEPLDDSVERKIAELINELRKSKEELANLQHKIIKLYEEKYGTS